MLIILVKMFTLIIIFDYQSFYEQCRGNALYITRLMLNHIYSQTRDFNGKRM